MSGKSYIPTRDIYLQKLRHVIDFTYELVIKCDVRVVENTFTDNWK